MVEICDLLGGYRVVVLKKLLGYASGILNKLHQKLICSAFD